MSETKQVRDDDDDEDDGVGAAPSKAVRATAPAKRSILPVLLLGCVLGAAVVYFMPRGEQTGPKSERPKPPGMGVAAVDLPTWTRAPWIERGFVEMVPPLKPPSRPDGKQLIEVWVKFASTGRLSVKWLPDQKRNSLVYPAGTIADRLEIIDGDPARIVDVRGTDLGENGAETFHVYRHDGQGLHGFAWKRDDADAQKEATRALIEFVRWEEPRAAPRELESLSMNNECGPCHEHDRPGSRMIGRGRPSRAGDSAGFFVPATVLVDRIPVEHHRPREMNVGDPFVRFACVAEDGTETEAILVDHKDKTKWPECADGSDPIGVVDLKAALAANDAHAKRVCSSRKALFDHMDDAAKKSFADAFATCGIGG